LKASHDGKLTSDRESLRSGGSVCLGALSEGCALRAVRSVDVGGDCGPDSCLVAPARTPSRGSADEAESGEEVLNALHCEVERLYVAVTRVV
jgi:hypothetical protein